MSFQGRRGFRPGFASATHMRHGDNGDRSSKRQGGQASREQLHHPCSERQIRRKNKKRDDLINAAALQDHFSRAFGLHSVIKWINTVFLG